MIHPQQIEGHWAIFVAGYQQTGWHFDRSEAWQDFYKFVVVPV